MTYVNGFVAAVPTANRDIYREHSEAAAVVFKDHGALKLVECWGDDVPDGEVTSFPMAVKCQPDETVCFSWVVWPSKEACKAGWEKIMAEASKNSWKDEAWTILFIAIIAMCFIPPLQPYVERGFIALESTPQWFQWAMYASIAASFGLRGLKGMKK